MRAQTHLWLMQPDEKVKVHPPTDRCPTADVTIGTLVVHGTDDNLRSIRDAIDAYLNEEAPTAEAADASPNNESVSEPASEAQVHQCCHTCERGCTLWSLCVTDGGGRRHWRPKTGNDPLVPIKLSELKSALDTVRERDCGHYGVIQDGNELAANVDEWIARGESS